MAHTMGIVGDRLASPMTRCGPMARSSIPPRHARLSGAPEVRLAPALRTMKRWRSFLPAISLLIATAGAAAGMQEPATLSGRVVERDSGQPVAGATVLLRDATRLTTDAGTFRFTDVEPGRYVLRVSAIGYRPAEMTVVLRRDTTVDVELEVEPVALDTIAVRTRTVHVRGVVRDAETGTGLIDVEVSRGAERERTDPIGRFDFEDVPAASPQVIEVRGFGYLPVTVEVTAERDTTLEFALVEDPLAQRMIDVQVERLEMRAHPYVTPIMPAIDREDLMKSINWTVLDIINTRYGNWMGRVGCILIDDVQTRRGIEELGLMLPDRIQRIELLFRGRMLRVYTRDFIRRMLGGGVTLKPPLYVTPPAPAYCR